MPPHEAALLTIGGNSLYFLQNCDTHTTNHCDTLLRNAVLLCGWYIPNSKRTGGILGVIQALISTWLDHTYIFMSPWERTTQRISCPQPGEPWERFDHRTRMFVENMNIKHAQSKPWSRESCRMFLTNGGSANDCLDWRILFPLCWKALRALH